MTALQDRKRDKRDIQTVERDIQRDTRDIRTVGKDNQKDNSHPQAFQEEDILHPGPQDRMDSLDPGRGRLGMKDIRVVMPDVRGDNLERHRALRVELGRERQGNHLLSLMDN